MNISIIINSTIGTALGFVAIFVITETVEKIRKWRRK